LRAGDRLGWTWAGAPATLIGSEVQTHASTAEAAPRPDAPLVPGAPWEDDAFARLHRTDRPHRREAATAFFGGKVGRLAIWVAGVAVLAGLAYALSGGSDEVRAPADRAEVAALQPAAQSPPAPPPTAAPAAATVAGTSAAPAVVAATRLPAPSPASADTARPAAAAPAAVQPALTARQRVAEAQRLLSRLGYYRSSVDGVSGPLTQRAIDGFRRDAGLPRRQGIDDLLLRRLREAAQGHAAAAHMRPARRRRRGR